MTNRILYGELRTGRIIGSLDVTGAGWLSERNDSGSVPRVTVPADVVRRLNLKYGCPAARCFLAFEEDDTIRQAGPIWSRSWDDDNGVLTMAAGGLWSLWDHRKVMPLLGGVGQPANPQAATTVVSNTDLGGIARALIAQAILHLGGAPPLVLPTANVGTRTETFPGWKLQWIGDQLRQLTTRETGAPDIRFTPRRKTDPRFIEWVMECGTETAPLLTQVGDDWTFDRTVPKTPVLSINTDEDANDMGMRAWVTGNGTEEDRLISRAYDRTLIDLGWPLLEVDESRYSVEDQPTLDGHSASLLSRSARPVEVWTVKVRSAAAREVLPGHYANVITKGSAWIPDGSHRMRIKSMSGDYTSDTVTMTMHELAAPV